MDPENNSGVKAPDLTGVPTGTYQVVSVIPANAVQSSNANFTGAGIWISPRVYQGAYQTIASIDDTFGTYTWTAPVTIPGCDTNSIYRETRLVSACVKFEYTGSTLYDAGVQVGIYTPLTLPGTAAGSNAVPVSAVAAMASPYSEMYPLRNGICVLWRPIDPSDFFFTTSVGGASNEHQNSFGIVISSLDTTNFQTMPGFFTITMNWEAVPQSQNQNLVQLKSGPSEGYSAIEQAYKWSQNLSDKIYPLFNAAAPYAQMAAQIAGATYLNNQRARLQDRRQPIIELVE